MLVITDAALDRLHTEIERVQSDTPGEACFRLVPRNGAALTLMLQPPESTDETFEHEGEVVLALPKSIAEAIGDSVLDLDGNGWLVLRQ